MSRRHPGKRNRERKSKRIVQRWEWWYRGRVVVIVEITKQGQPLITRTVPRFRVNDTDGSREQAAAWLREILPRLSHEETYAILWHDP